jgi:hypothetical protein
MPGPMFAMKPRPGLVTTTGPSRKAATHDAAPEKARWALTTASLRPDSSMTSQRLEYFYGRARGPATDGTDRSTAAEIDARISVMPAPVQRMPTVSSPRDPYEHEADDVADKVMRMADPAPIGSVPPVILRKASGSEKEEGAPSAHPGDALDAGAAVRAAERGGQPLSSEVRSHFEPRFGYDFSAVRVRADSEAAEAARAVQARAFTVGRNIVFGHSEFAPGTVQGRRLIAHELAHVIQQGAAGARGPREGNAVSSTSSPGTIVQRDAAADAAEAARVAQLKADYAAAVKKPDWETAAQLLNGFNDDDILVRLKSLKKSGKLFWMALGAFTAMPGWDGRVTDPIKKLDPEAYRVGKLTSDYNLAVRAKNWPEAAKVLNAFNEIDIGTKLNALSSPDLAEMEKAAINAGIGRVAKPAHDLVSARLVGETQKLVGKLYWAGPSGPDPAHGFQIETTHTRPKDDLSGTEVNTNDFAVWIRGGADPTDISKMNCWEAVMYSAWKAGFASKKWIVDLHTKAAADGLAAGSGAAYMRVLEKGLGFNSAILLTGANEPKAGDLVFMNGLAHVALSTGAKVGGANHEVLSLWILPGSGARLVSTLQRTTIEDINAAWVAAGKAAMVVKFAPNPW